MFVCLSCIFLGEVLLGPLEANSWRFEEGSYCLIRKIATEEGEGQILRTVIMVEGNGDFEVGLGAERRERDLCNALSVTVLATKASKRN